MQSSDKWYIIFQLQHAFGSLVLTAMQCHETPHNETELQAIRKDGNFERGDHGRDLMLCRVHALISSWKVKNSEKNVFFRLLFTGKTIMGALDVKIKVQR